MVITKTTVPPLSPLPPEVVDMIFRLLYVLTLVVCARVNSTWHDQCIPHLWRVVYISSGPNWEDFMTIEAQRALSRNTGHIRELKLAYPSVYSIFAPTDTGSRCLLNGVIDIPYCTKLERVLLNLFRDPVKKSNGKWGMDFFWNRGLGTALEAGVVTLIRQNPGLKALTIHGSMTHDTLLSLLAFDLPNLQEFEYSPVYSFNQHITKALLEILPDRIRKVIVRVDLTETLSNTSIDAPVPRFGIQEPRQHHALEYLLITGSFRTPEDYLFLLPFLETCSKRLNKLEIPGIGWVRQPQVKDAVFRLGGSLSWLNTVDLPNLHNSGDAEIADCVRLSATWERIYLERCHDVGPLTVVAILDNCTFLKLLDLSYCGRVSSKVLISILGKAQCLEEFEALERGWNIGNNPAISALDLIDLNWASRTLRKFCCRIQVLRFDPENEDASSEDSNLVASRTIQRQVCRKLGQQASLRHLGLGACYDETLEIRDRHYQTQCLELSLESGLDELAGLSKLKALDVGYMRQRIGIRELEWMDKSWPKLRLVTGLVRSWADPEPGTREWVRDKRPSWAPKQELKWFKRTGAKF